MLYSQGTSSWKLLWHNTYSITCSAIRGTLILLHENELNGRIKLKQRFLEEMSCSYFVGLRNRKQVSSNSLSWNWINTVFRHPASTLANVKISTFLQVVFHPKERRSWRPVKFLTGCWFSVWMKHVWKLKTWLICWSTSSDRQYKIDASHIKGEFWRVRVFVCVGGSGGGGVGLALFSVIENEQPHLKVFINCHL